MRVAFVLNALGTGGAEIHTVTLAAALRERGHECLLAPLLDGDLDRRGLETAIVGGNGLANVRAMARLGALLRSWRADLVLAVNERPLTYAHLAQAVGGPRFPTAFVYHTTDLQTPKQRCLLALAEPLIARSDALIFVSSNQREKWLRHGLRARRIETIRNGIDAERFSPAAADTHRVEMRARLGFEGSDYVIGLSAAFRPEKNHVQALDALAGLRAQGLRARLLLVGDGPLRPAVEAQAAARGLGDAVTFAGRQADVIPWLSAFDVGLLTSTAIETFSLAALEIMGLGIPVVLSDLGGASEMVEAGETGQLFSVGDTTALVEALGNLAAPEARRAMGVAAAKRVQRDFTQDKMVARYEALFQEMLGA